MQRQGTLLDQSASNLSIRTLYISKTKGHKYTEDLRVSEKRLFYATRLKQDAFKDLLKQLKTRGFIRDIRYILATKKLIMFLKLYVKGLSYRDLQEVYYYSALTISRYFYQVLNSLVELYKEVVKMLDKQALIPERIEDSGKFFPYFRDYIGAIDRSYVPIFTFRDLTPQRNRKTQLSQNVLAIYRFDGQFIYIYIGQEGSAYDARVLKDALSKTLAIPKGRYLLVDVGYLNSTIALVLYRGTRYYLQEWQQVDLRPSNKEELFNLRYSLLRNAIKRAFSVIKKRQKVLRLAHKFSIID